jgi:hypothetical protein
VLTRISAAKRLRDTTEFEARRAGEDRVTVTRFASASGMPVRNGASAAAAGGLA